MRLDTVLVVAKREYMQRIQSKGFWIATLILPLFIAGVTILPTLLLTKTKARQHVVVIDQTGKVAPELAAGTLQDKKDRQERAAELSFSAEPPAPEAEAQRAALDRRVLAGEIDAWIWIGPGALTSGNVEYHAKSISNLVTQSVLRDSLSNAVRRVRLRGAGYDADRVGSLSQPVDLKPEKVSKTGRPGGGNAETGFFFGIALFMMLYVTLAIWGQQVMQGVLEEKSSRVIEVIVSAVKPFELMMGKLTGICLAGLTQFGIWLLTIAAVTAPGVAAKIAGLPPGALPVVTPVMLINFPLLFLLGFFIFSTFYAAIGAAFNNLQEAQQVASIAVFFLIIPAMLMTPVINDPGSTFATVMSLIPPFTPLLMTLRIGLEMPPLWQILLGYALTLSFIVVAVWACARIYRVGILMYGKKPTFQELWKWMRYPS